jgi:cell division protein FtsL
MSRLNLLLLVVAVLSALALVHTAYDSRRLFAATERARAEAERLAAEEVRLQAERQAQATNIRVEKVARERLNMRPATPAVTQYVSTAVPVALPSRAASAPLEAAR